jgi:alpha-galactosidase
MDPSLDETLDIVAADLARFRDWGYDLVKHDFSSYDVLGRFLSDGTAELTSAPWRFADESRTTAEILVAFYTRIKETSAGVTIIGCNVVGHLAAGLVEAQRTGDDTSGRHWERTRRMGVNTLAFRLAQHNSFFTVDPDCVPSTHQTPWETNRQFLDLIAHSGAALFVSVDPTTRTPEIDADLTQAIRTALDGGAKGGVDPLDWQTTSAPRRWRVGAQVREYSWSMPWGTDLGIADI